MLSFKILDYGSILCADKLSTMVYDDLDEKVNLLKEAYPDVSVDGDIYDTLLCDAINKATNELNRIIKSDSATGTTFIGTFIRIAKDGSCHIICANIGDSRAIVHYNKMTAPISEDHNLSLEREKKRIDEHAAPVWSHLPTDLLFPLVATKHLTGKPIILTFRLPTETRAQYAKDLVTFLKMNKTDFFEQKEDIETLLIMMETELIPQDILDQDMDESYHSVLYHSNNNNNGNGSKSKGDINQSSGSETDINGSKTKRNKYYAPKQPIADEAPALNSDEEFVTMKPTYRTTLVQPRKNAAGEKVGPVALTSRQGVSIMMTRSIGDRNAARTCVCVPDFYKIIIPKGEYARVLLGSDGMWDVMPNTMAASYSLKQKELQQASQFVVYRARELREEAPMRIDDITCIVIDINTPDIQTQNTATTGGEDTECSCIVN